MITLKSSSGSWDFAIIPSSGKATVVRFNISLENRGSRASACPLSPSLMLSLYRPLVYIRELDPYTHRFPEGDVLFTPRQSKLKVPALSP
jgi:hypothetical protein